MSGEPDWRGECAGTIPDAFPLSLTRSVIDPKLPRLSLHELSWERFEDLVLDIVREVEKPVRSSRMAFADRSSRGSM